MSDECEIFSAIKDHKKRLRAKYGIPCPECVKKLPKACPTILLPQQRCRIHKYVDQKPKLTNKQYQKI